MPPTLCACLCVCVCARARARACVRVRAFVAHMMGEPPDPNYKLRAHRLTGRQARMWAELHRRL